MKAYKRPEYPTNLLFFDCETKARRNSGEEKSEKHFLWFGMMLAYRRDNGERTRIKRMMYTTPDEFWNALISRLDNSRPLWVFAHNLIFDLTIVDCWTKADEYGIDVNLPVLEDPPIFLCCQHERGKVNFVDTFNYWKNSVADIGKSIGLNKLDMPTGNKINQQWKDYCQRDVDVISTAVDNLIQWLKSNDLGPLSFTIASIAMGTYKHRFMPRNCIHVHDNEPILQLERQSYHGGLTHPYFIGERKEKIWKLDVNSLYPTMMLEKYPIRMESRTANITPSALLAKSSKWGLLADVTINTDKTPYPVVHSQRLVEGVGNFRCVLCGPELLDALSNGNVQKVNYAVMYEMAYIFNDYVKYFYDQRQRYKNKGDNVSQYFCKILLNSLYGKFGQQYYKWIDLTYDVLDGIYQSHGLTIPEQYEDSNSLPVFSFGHNKWQPLGLPDPLQIRFVGNLLQVKLLEGEHHESCPIIASYVTSYSRQHMRELRTIAGHYNTFYCDTDSLFVNAMGFQRLNRAGWISSSDLGKLKIEGIENYLHVYGPKDYIFGSQKVHKGIRHNAKAVCPHCDEVLSEKWRCKKCRLTIKEVNKWEQLQFEGIASILKRKPDPYIEIKTIRKTLHRQYTKGTVSPSGWTEYPVLSLDDQ